MPDAGWSNYQEQMRRENRRLAVIMWSSIIAIVSFFGAVGYYAVSREREAHARFMRQCVQDHKEYECTALWRAGDPPSPNIIFLPIPIGK